MSRKTEACPTPPTPSAGQAWRSTAADLDASDGRVDVIGTVYSPHHGLVVVEHLVRGGSSLSAVPVVEFLRRRAHPHRWAATIGGCFCVGCDAPKEGEA